MGRRHSHRLERITVGKGSVNGIGILFSSSPVFTFEPASSASKLPPLQTRRNAVQRLFRCLSQAPRHGGLAGIPFAVRWRIPFRPTQPLHLRSHDPLRLESATDMRVAAVMAGVHSFRDIPCAGSVALERITRYSLQCQSRVLAPARGGPVWSPIAVFKNSGSEYSQISPEFASRASGELIPAQLIMLAIKRLRRTRQKIAV